MNLKLLLLLTVVVLVGIFIYQYVRIRDVSIVVQISFDKHSEPDLSCTSLSNLADLEILKNNNIDYPCGIESTNFKKYIWVYSSLPVHRVSYSREMSGLFITPEVEKENNKVFFVLLKKIPHTYVKMTAADQNCSGK